MAKKNSEFDVIIAGGGPAGLSALLWCAELGLNAILLEKEPEFGGQLLHTHNAIRNYPGIEETNGCDLRDAFLRQIENLSGIKRLTGVEIVEADLIGKNIKLADGAEYLSRAIFIATGVRRRKLKVPGEEEFYGRGVLESGVKSIEDVRDKNVVIVGGGDAAIENAVILSKTAARIFVVHRRNHFSARREFVKRANESENIEVVFDTQIKKITGNEGVDSVELEHLSSGNISQIEVDFVLVRIGVEPNTELFRGQIDLDSSGYIQIDANCATSISGIYAGGDVANPVAKSISTSIGNGAAAAKAILHQFS